MSLDQIALTVPVRQGGHACGVKRMMDRLDGADREWFERNLAGEANATWIADVLVEGKLRLPNGKALSDGIITRHRRRMCSCWDAS